MKKRLLFIDRDGTIIIEPPDEQIDSFEKLQFYPAAISNLRRIAEELNFELVMVTNQDGLGTKSFPEATFWPVHNKMLEILKGENIVFNDILIDRTFPKDNEPTRKPGTALLKYYLNGDFDIKNSFVIGDRQSDVTLAKNLGCKSILLSNSSNEQADFVTKDWADIYRYLLDKDRITEINRDTNETKIYIKLNLDGNGKSRISTGLDFFDHMLEQISRHSGIDLEIKVKGDLEIDEHHTIEDTAIALGLAFNQALAKKIGIERYGFMLPMDDCLSQVALDFSGRSWLVWNVKFKRETVGKIPTEMFFHFFKSFSDNAQCNLNISADGQNEHHKIEAVFKAFARAIKQAVNRKQGDTSLPSTKGSL